MKLAKATIYLLFFGASLFANEGLVKDVKVSKEKDTYTFSLANVKIHNIKTVYVRAHDSVDGYSVLYEVTIP